MKWEKIIQSSEIPQILLDYQKQLEEELYKHDVEVRNNLKEEYKKLGYNFWYKPEYNKVWVTKLMESNSETIKKESEKKAKKFVEDLWNKINSKIDNVVDIVLHINGGNIEGLIIGDNCNVRIATILAGGPIQRLHNRCLVKVLKK